MTAPGQSLELFEAAPDVPATLVLGPGAVLLRRFAGPLDRALLQGALDIAAAAPWRQMLTPGGRRMSVSTTSCGALGWISDARGYRYSPVDPLTGRPWPALPPAFKRLSTAAAAAAGYGNFEPDSCLLNRYVPGTGMGLHEDRQEADFSAPIVSVSLGIDAVFRFGGARRTDGASRVALSHGDVVVWGGASRRYFHGILPLKPGSHPALGECRINLTFRRAG